MYRDKPLAPSPHNRFSEVMSRCGDFELVGILEEPVDNWQPEALVAANDEIERRALSSEVLEEITAEVELTSKMARAPLERAPRALAFVAGILGVIPGLIGVYFYTRYQRRGHAQKARDLIRWFSYGVGTHIVAVLFVALRR